MSTFWPAVAGAAASVLAQLARPAPDPGAAGPPGGMTSFQAYDWEALVTRVALGGGVDYATLARVRRLLHLHLDRLSEARPDRFGSDDERMAFYLNAYNAIAVYQVLLRYPVRSICAIPAAFTRPFPVGHENLSLHGLHGRLRRFGDPRVHAALVPATSSAPRLRVYTAAGLQGELDAQLWEFLADRRIGLRPMPDGKGVILNPIFRTYAGDFITPEAMPGVAHLLRAYTSPRGVLQVLRPYAPAELQPLMDRPEARVAFLTYDWNLNDTA
jgi:hypothetical protein